MVYKIIIKVLVNHIRLALGNIISLLQCSFIQGRNTSDNILMAHKLVHISRNKSKKDLITYKIDLEKAHDRVNMVFLRDSLVDLGLSTTL